MQAEGPDVGSILTIWDDVSELDLRVLKGSGIPQATLPGCLFRLFEDIGRLRRVVREHKNLAKE